MNASTQPDSPLRQALLDQIASITTMRPGSLAEEYREHPAVGGHGTVRHGPYYKHQLWQDGRNVSRRVPVAEAATLKLDIENARCFRQLTDELAQLNIEYTLTLRATEDAAADAVAEKKTSKPVALRRNTAQQNTSSPNVT